MHLIAFDGTNIQFQFHENLSKVWSEIHRLESLMISKDCKYYSAFSPILA